MLRVEGDNVEYSDVFGQEVTEQKSGIHHSLQYPAYSSVEILVRMSPPLRGVFSQQDYDLTLAFDRDHYDRNKETLDRLKVGSDIEFTGFVRNLGSFGKKSPVTQSAE